MTAIFTQSLYFHTLKSNWTNWTNIITNIWIIFNSWMQILLHLKCLKSVTHGHHQMLNFLPEMVATSFGVFLPLVWSLVSKKEGSIALTDSWIAFVMVLILIRKIYY